MLFVIGISGLKKDLLKVFSGNIVAQGIGYLAVILISRNLGPEKFGVFSLLIAFFTITVQISEFGLTTPYIKFVSQKKNKIARNDVFFSILVVRVIIALFISALVYLLSKPLCYLLFSSYRYIYEIRIVAIVLVFHALYKMIISHYQALQYFRSYLLQSVSNQFLKLILVIATIWLYSSQGNLLHFYVIFMVSIIPLLVILILNNISLIRRAAFCLSEVKAILRMGFWVFFSSISVLIMMQLDILMLQKLSNPDEVGYYAAANQLAMIFPLLTMSIVTTLLPKLDDYLNKHTIKEYVFNILLKSHLIIITLIVILFIAPYLVNLIYGETFSPSANVFKILIASFLIGVIVNPIALVLYFFDKAYILTVINWLQLVLNFCANLYFIPLYNAEGAALATSLVRIFGGLLITAIILFGDFCVKRSD